MSLLSNAMEPCVLYNISPSIPDGRGGQKENYSDGETFNAAIVLDTSAQARIAQKMGVTALYTVTTSRAFTLRYHDVFRRVSDGKTFRVTSDGDDKKTPRSTSLDMRQVSAEEWKIL